MNIFAEATAVARALGLDIELPDSDNDDPAYWQQTHADGGCKRPYGQSQMGSLFLNLSPKIADECRGHRVHQNKETYACSQAKARCRMSDSFMERHTTCGKLG